MMVLGVGTMGAVPLQEWPGDLLILRQHVVGLFVGGCVARGDGSRFRRQAHAHTAGDHKGWICVLSVKRLAEPDLMKHEAAHLISGEGHTAKFRAVLAALHGGALPKRERMVPRQSSWGCRATYHGLCKGKSDAPTRPGRCRCWCHTQRSDA